MYLEFAAVFGDFEGGRVFGYDKEEADVCCFEAGEETGERTRKCWAELVWVGLFFVMFLRRFGSSTLKKINFSCRFPPEVALFDIQNLITFLFGTNK